jgi:hypothetical protein
MRYNVNAGWIESYKYTAEEKIMRVGLLMIFMHFQISDSAGMGPREKMPLSPMRGTVRANGGMNV